MQVVSTVAEKTEAAFEKAMAAFGFRGRENLIAVAVSGGADSMALCRLLDKYTRKNGGRLIALTVDHGLRSESADEARWVRDETKRLGIPCRILKWEGEKPLTGIERSARDARYALLFAACREENARALFLGHHRRDQAETFLMRKAAKSGPFGLAGMSAVRSFAFGRMYRPLLGISPEDLRAYNESIGQTWKEDPTNATGRFERGRIRMSASAEVLEDAFRQSLLYGEKRIETEKRRTAFLRSSAEVSNAGYVSFSQSDICKADGETVVGCLAEVVRAVANKPYFPKADALDRLYENVLRPDFRGASLGGCRIAPSAKGRLLIWREYADLPPPLTVRNKRLFYWDRFAFELSEPVDAPLSVRPLKNELKELWGTPRRCFFVLPALFDREGLFLAPHLGYKKTKVSCRADFAPLFPLCLTPEWTLPVV